MDKLQPPDLHFVNAARGWLELGDASEGRKELDHVSLARKTHPEVLELRWELCAKEKDWAGALAAARQLVVLHPKRCSGWIHRAYTLHEMKHTQEAWNALRPALERFPKVTTIPYNLACYACQLGRMDEARSWLKKAIEVGQRQDVVQLALTDPDLKPLWPELHQ